MHAYLPLPSCFCSIHILFIAILNHFERNRPSTVRDLDKNVPRTASHTIEIENSILENFGSALLLLLSLLLTMLCLRPARTFLQILHTVEQRIERLGIFLNASEAVKRDQLVFERLVALELNQAVVI